MIESIWFSLGSTILFIFLFVYLPGKVFSKLAKLPDWLDLQLAVGLSLLPLILFFGRWLIPTIWILSLYLLITIFLFKKFKLKFKPAKLNLSLIALIVIFIGVLAQALPYIKPLILGTDQVIANVISSHDQSWHVSLIYELTHTFPPQIPGFSGTILKNYHYFYDLIIAANQQIFKGNIIFYLQVIYPIFISFFYGLSIWRLSTLLIKNKLIQILTIFLAYFANNLSFSSSNAFLIDQPLFFLFNHQTVLSIALLTYLFILIKNYLKKPTFKLAILSGLVLASLSYLKIYSFVIALIVLGIIAFKNLKQLKSFMLIFIPAGILTLTIIVLTFTPGGKFIDIKPGWILTAFSHKVLFPAFPNLLRLQNAFWYPAFTLIVFLVVNYFLRLLGFGYIFLKRKNNLATMLFLASLTGLLFVLFGYQSSSPYNIIQFVPYTTVYLVILTSVVLANLKSKKLTYIIFSLIILSSLPASLKTLENFNLTKVSFTPIHQELIETLQVLSSQSPGITLSLADRDYYASVDPNRQLNFIGNNLINSIGQQRSFFSDQRQLEVLNLNYQSRLSDIQSLKDNFCQNKDVIIKEKIRYLILPDDMIHCLPGPNIAFTILHQNKHFGLFLIKPKNI